MFSYPGSFENDFIDQVERMRQEMEALFANRPGVADIRSAASGTYPAINVGISTDRVDLYVFVAGIDPETLDISIQDNLLSIAGERQTDLPEDTRSYRSERFRGPFSRVVTLPDGVDQDQVVARYHDGLLHISVGRREPISPRRIDVR